MLVFLAGLIHVLSMTNPLIEQFLQSNEIHINRITMDTAYSAEIINKFNSMNLRPKTRNEPEYGKLTPEQILDITRPPINNHRPKSSFIPAICNFETARKMAQENLEHQPLPDAVMDIAFRKAQVAGSANPGAALEVGPYATGTLKFSNQDLWKLIVLFLCRCWL